jgi:hypothetical protein
MKIDPWSWAPDFIFRLFGMLLICQLLATPGLCADDPEARAIMQRVDAREDGDNQTADMEMILIDRHGAERVRKIASFSKDRGPDTLRLMFFVHPADVKDTAFLTVDYDDPQHDDDQWLYLPALRKTKRIATTDKSGSFMGSDLNYADMADRELEDYDYHFYEKGREQTFDGVKTWAIWATPRSKKVVAKTGYTKELAFIRQDNDFIIRSIHWVENSADLKYMMVKRLEKIDGIWVANELHVTRKTGKQVVHKTIIKLDQIRFNQDLDETLFSVRQMEKGL